MKTIATCVEEILISQPFLEDALTRNILNFSDMMRTAPLVGKERHADIGFVSG